MTIVDIVPILSAGEPEISTALGGYLRSEGMSRLSARTRGVPSTASARRIVLSLTPDCSARVLAAPQQRAFFCRVGDCPCGRGVHVNGNAQPRLPYRSLDGGAWTFGGGKDS